MIGDMEFEIPPAVNNRGLIVRFHTQKTHFTPLQLIERAEIVSSLEKRQSPTDEELARLRSLKALGESVEIELIELRQVGNSSQVSVTPVDEAARLRFPEEYAAFLAGEDRGVCGTRLADWGLLPRKIADELTDAGVRTVEELSGIADADLGGFLPYNNARRWRDAALKHIDEGDGGLTEMAATVRNQADEMIALRARLEELEAIKGKTHG